MGELDSTMTRSTSASPADLRLIRSEVNFLIYPFFCLDNRWHTDRLKIEYHRILDRGEGREEISWRVLAHQEYGLPGPFDWELHKAIEAIINERGFPVRNPIPFSMRELCRRMGISYAGSKIIAEIKAAFLRITSTMVESKRTFYSKPKKRWLEDNFHLYDRVVYRGDELPDSAVPADTNYLFLGSWYLENLNALYVSLLDPHYRRSLAVSLARRLYEILGVKFYGLRTPKAPGLRYAYSTVCALLPVKRYRYLSDAHRQLDPAHQELVSTGFLERVTWQPVVDSPPDWHLLYVPGPHALQPTSALPPGMGENLVLDLQEPGATAHVGLSTRPRRRRPRPAASTPRAAPLATAPPEHAADAALTTAAPGLVQDFHTRFHGTSDVLPSAKELTQAQALLARHGLELAQYLIDFSYTAAQETGYRPQTFGGILQYAARARAAYAQAQARAAAEERAREERRRAQEEAQLRRLYEDYCAARLAELRATAPPDVLAAVEEAAAAHFERDNPSRFGRERLRRIAVDDAVAAHWQLPTFAEWHATQGLQESISETTA